MIDAQVLKQDVRVPTAQVVSSGWTTTIHLEGTLSAAP